MRYHSAVRGLLLLFLATIARAQDPQLEPLRATLAVIRAHADEARVNRGARPELTIAKHQLRDWIESRLASLEQQGDEQKAAIEINAELGRIGEPNPPPIDGIFDNLVGKLGPVRLARESAVLLLTTGIGILCGYDESAYAYEWRDGVW